MDAATENERQTTEPADGPGPRPVPAPARTPDGQNLGDHTARGALWSLAQTVASKIISTGGQLVLAWLLSPKDFGLVGLAYTIYWFASLVQQLGLNEILVQRGRQFQRWANAAFWMSLGAGVLAGGVMLAAAPVAATLYGHRELVGIIAVIAISCPAYALSTVPLARMQIDLRFRAINVVTFWAAVAQTGLSIALAAMHFGVYSFVLPRPIVLAGQAIFLWAERPARVRAVPQFRRWRFLLSDSRYVFAAWIFFALISQGDYMSLGIFQSATVVGIYYFGFNLSFQLNTLFTQSVAKVLLPVLSRFQQNPNIQRSIYLRGATLLGVISAPCCLLMAALASPAIHLFFGAKWYGSIPVVQALSVGMTLSVVGTTGHVMLQSQGRYRALMILSAGSFVIFAALVLWGASSVRGERAAAAVGLAVGLFHLIYGPLSLWAAVKPLGGTWLDVLKVHAGSVTAAVLAVAGAFALGHAGSRLLAGEKVGELFTLLVTTALTFPLYFVLIRLAAPSAAEELWRRTLRMLGRPAVESRAAVERAAS